MALNGSDAYIWLDIDIDCFSWLRMAPDGSRLLQIAPDCSRWLDMALNGHMATNGLTWPDKYLDASRWLQLAIYGSRRLKWFQMTPVGCMYCVQDGSYGSKGLL